ncbi:cation-transporting ATPase 13A2 isoform X2 [Boleophthalmus pectinirostris]|uniref:cation-transporting ATPase 13A2 isoform X2 n=1 Tax=Boleophthalmus pectinirostris TaxID=150288 RepID=UPI00242AD9CF|nr:cation-transporting ATPase 13A2 isoform X2 [Boleophthalmus pectinirostris]
MDNTTYFFTILFIPTIPDFQNLVTLCKPHRKRRFLYSGWSRGEPPSELPTPCAHCPLLCPDSHMDARGYKWVRWRVWLCRVLALLTGGLLALFFYWRPRLGVLARCSSCPLALAEVLLIRDSGDKQHVVKVYTEEMEEGSWEMLGELDDTESRDTVQLYQQDQKTLLRYYLLDGLRYVWLDRKGSFVRVSILNEDWTCQDLHEFQRGLSPQEQMFRRQVYGSNLIDVPVKSYIQLLFEEVLNPFYIFQLASVCLWLSDHYYYYAVCIIVISLISIGVSLYEIRKQSVTLHNMARLVVDVKIRKSSGEEQVVSSVDLVPGDCILIPAEGLLLPCDAALLTGECLVNESMLTGESVPVLKTPLPAGDHRYNSEKERRYTLFCGTQVIQGKGDGPEGSLAVAVVTSTGFFTAKGNLVSSILYPQDSDFRFNRDASKFLLFLGLIACMGTIYSIHLLVKYNASLKDIIVRSLDIVTIVVPPALPAAITTATLYAQQRLKKLDVFCISPPRINISGKVSVFCFDKTGTLTEDGLDVWGVMEGSSAGFSELVPNPSCLPPGPVLSALACCHTLTLLHGNPLGDPLDLKMVESTGWILDEPQGNRQTLNSEFGGHRVLAVMKPPTEKHTNAVAIVRRFPFSSALQRMSVVTVTPGGQSVVAFLKGSPEMVASLCKEETVPAQFTTTLSNFSKDGLRVLALGYKPIALDTDLNTIQRGEVEKDLHFLGLLMMKNLVKTETPSVINMLKLASLRTIMVTGDNILTAVNVAKSCGMIGSDERVIFVKASPHTDQSRPTLRYSLADDGAAAQDSIEINTHGLYQSGYNYHLAINGKSFAVLSDYFPDQLPKVLMRATVFARMAPDQKTQLVTELRKLKYRVGMCGDGANDCGALRAADVGISLSEAEASVASPFTSKIQNISCVPLLIREGRCSLVTSFSLFRYVALYSLIQFCSVLILYTMRTNLADLQFLFFDLVLVTFLAIVMGKGGPSDELHTRRPPASLWSLPVLGSLLIHASLVVLGQTGAILFTISQDWYVPINGTIPGEDNWPNIEDTSLFAVSGFQYIFMAIVVTKAHPHKKPLYYNGWFLALLLLFSALMIWLVMYPVAFIRRFLSLYPVDDMGFKFVLVGLAALNFFTCLLMELLVDLGLLNCLRLLRGRRQSKKPYKRLDSQLSESSWPPLNQTLCPSHNTVLHLS